MWIRSQNRGFFINAKAFDMRQLRNNSQTEIIAWIGDMLEESYGTLGVYDTEAQALKVMDMIKFHLENMYYNSLSCHKYTKNFGSLQNI